MSDYILKHHGIQGQKWGVRRYQNADGTRTAAGKKRYNTRYVEADGKRLTKRGKRKLFAEADKNLRYAQRVYKVSDKYAKGFSDKADKFLGKANASEKGSKQEARAMKGYTKNIENARRVERGEDAVKNAHETIMKAKLDKWTDPNATKTQAYKEAKKIVNQYGRATMYDFYTTGTLSSAHRRATLYRIGSKTNKKPKYGYIRGESYLV